MDADPRPVGRHALGDCQRPARGPFLSAPFGCVPKLSMATPKACAIETRRWLLAIPVNTGSPGLQDRLEDGQSAGASSLRPIRSLPLRPPPNTVGTLRVLCRAGFPMSLLA